MGKISVFVCYRREDSQFQTDRICDHLIQAGQFEVFQDVDRMPPGLDFRRVLTERVIGCDVFLAVIGDAWLSISGPSGNRRLNDAADFVRVEIEAALGRDIPVIPVLVGTSSVPAAEDLPENLRELAFRHGVHVRPNPDFRHDMERLIRGIADAVTALRNRPGSDGTQIVAAVDAESLPSAFATEPPKSPPTVRCEPLKEITNNIGMKLVLIPAGEFLMGSLDSDTDAYDDEKPQHRVQISRPFYLGRYTVTQAQYAAVTGENPSHFEGSNDLPVENVSWDDAIAFCDTLSKREGLKPYYQSGSVAPLGAESYRLPTEAEWEYACQAGVNTRYSFGDDSASVGDFAWYSRNAKSKTHPVGQKRPNPWGLYDMHGNVWEWCRDGYAAHYYNESPVADPLGPPQSLDRVFRGGGWHDDPRDCRRAFRGGITPEFRYDFLGFRVARSFPPP
jgi:formylglycine-generating enzyme required for sulfatase activity